MTQTRLLGARILAAVLSVIVGLSACANQGQESTTPTSVQSTHLLALSSRATWPDALVMAQEWRSDAYVSGVDVDIRLPNDPASHSRVTWTFQSPGEDLLSLCVRCDIEGCQSFEVEHTLPVWQCTPITLDDFTLDSSDVLDIGLQHGGQAYVQRRTASVLLQLYRHSPYCTGSVQWTAKFDDLATTGGLMVIIDAVTGEVIEVLD